MITSSVLNSITFKNLDGGNPNKWNTLHADRKQAGFTILPYCQKYNKGEVINLQFESDSAVVPSLEIYIPFLNETIVATLDSSYSGIVNRYFYGFQITLGAAYYDKKISYKLIQGADELHSEPIYCYDISEDLENGVLKKVKYHNLDRNESDLSSFWVDWAVVDYMHFYIEATDINPKDPEEQEILESSQSKTIISASNYSGISLESSGVPDYMVLKMKTASSLDFFEVNGIQYVKEGDVDSSQFGGSTSHTISVELTEKNTIGLNVDDVGIVYIDSEEVPMAIIPKRNTEVDTGGWEVQNPEGYMLHSIFLKHAGSSVGNAVVTCGSSIAGSDIIDSVQGNTPLADYSGKWRAYTPHFLKNPDAASTIYFSVAGAGAILDIIVNFDLLAE